MLFLSTGTGTGSGTVQPQTGQCVDKLTNCNEFGAYACKQPYLAWAQDKCPRYCNFCSKFDVLINLLILSN